MQDIIQKPSPNFWQGRNGQTPIAFVIHVMQGTLEGTDSWFANPQSQVSAHFGVGKNGSIHQYVKQENSAWHAGRVDKPVWKLLKKDLLGRPVNPNYYTIGIECEGNAGEHWTESQMNSVCDLIRLIKGNIPVIRDTIVSHHEIASYKENMSEWCDEIVKRFAPPPATDNTAEAINLLERAIQLLKK